MMDTHLAFHLTEMGTVSPENRHNGTQSFDGWFPRFFSEPQYAKSSLTKFLGESVVWEEDSSNAL